MIEATRHEWIKRAFYRVESGLIFPRKFNKIRVNEIELLPNHSVLLLQNHFSWWDGFFGSYLAYQYLHKSYHVMVQEDQLKKHWYFKYKGAFSIKKQSREMRESINYAAHLLEDAANMVLVFPQGRLQSMHTDDIEVQKGTLRLIESVKGNCQVIYNAVSVEYLESFKPTVTFNLLDCGRAQSIQTGELAKTISEFHAEAKKRAIRP
ncbi:MAG: 1-acyl-sn-glycerol-3-phosphate acyltransferase [Cyclobacteriaceae bacterium]